MGTVIATLAAGVASDAAGNPSAASTSTDNTVTVTGLCVRRRPARYTVVVPAGAGPVTFNACGAGGGGGANSGTGAGGTGGAGGCVGGTFPVPAAGVTLTVVVGQGGTITGATATGYGAGGGRR